jgi:beta-carotene hydroxylase
MTVPQYAPDPQRQVPRVEVPPLGELDLPAPSRLLAPSIILRPFLAWGLAMGLAAAGHLVLALLVLPMAFSWGLCAVHCAVHRSLGVSERTNELLLTLSGMLLFESGHAMAVTHIHHHQADPGAEDPEAYIETLGWGALIKEAPRYRYRMWGWAARQGFPRPGAAALEAAWNGGSLILAVLLLPVAAWLSVMIAAIHVGNAIFVVAAARGPHTNYGRPITSPFVKVRGRIIPWFLAGHAWHVEHHLYPQIPLPGLRRALPALDPILDRLGAHEVRVP